MAGNCKSAEGGNPPDSQSRHSSNRPPRDSQPAQSSSLPPPPTKSPPQQFQPLFIPQETLGQAGRGPEEEVPKFPPIIPGYLASTSTLGGYKSHLRLTFPMPAVFRQDLAPTSLGAGLLRQSLRGSWPIVE